jgi:hypothetical protein
MNIIQQGTNVVLRRDRGIKRRFLINVRFEIRGRLPLPGINKFNVFGAIKRLFDSEDNDEPSA